MRRNSRGLEVAQAPADADIDQRSERTILGRHSNGWQLQHRSVGTALAGSILHWQASETWYVSKMQPNGSTIGQGYKTLAEAQTRFNELEAK